MSQYLMNSQPLFLIKPQMYLVLRERCLFFKKKIILSLDLLMPCLLRQMISIYCTTFDIFNEEMLYHAKTHMT